MPRRIRFRNNIPHSTENRPRFREERFDLAFFISLGIFALFFLMVFIPVIGPILILTFVPYFAGYQSGKFINKNDGMTIAFLTAFIWSIFEIIILLMILNSLNLGVQSPGLYTGTDWLIVSIVFLCNISFCILGTIYSPREFEVVTED
ncbi:MAG: hypothetical protein JSV49_06440 [Thermoplasmata archaeon]|nr:MAG: hypothetical protein JSV49_06440 [Thermoplasmata archaeon]